VTSGTPRDELDDLLREADAATYEAKGRGGARFVVANSAIVDLQRQNIRLQSEIRDALGTGQFVPWFQPIVQLENRAPVAFETLIRWVRPSKETMSASQFIDGADETGLFTRVSCETRAAAIDHAGTWSRDIRLSLNLSAGELLEP